MKELEITLQRLESTVVLHAAGPADSNTASQLQEPLLRAAEGPTGAVELDLAEYAGSVPRELLSETDFPPIGVAPYLLALPPHGFVWLSL